MPGGSQDLFSALLLPVAFIAVMYFMIFLPQKKREKAKKEMQSSINVGDNVITIGGIMGRVVNIKDEEVTIETSIEKTQIKLVRVAVDSVVTPQES